MCTSWSLWDQPTTRWLQTVVVSFGPLVMVLLLSWVITSETGVAAPRFQLSSSSFPAFVVVSDQIAQFSMECRKT